MYTNNNPKQPDALHDILALRPSDAETPAVPVDNLPARMKGALLGRFIGCTLGVPVENYPVLYMQALAAETGTDFPPTTYWKGSDRPAGYMHYGINPLSDYLEDSICCAPGDDDITYVILNLLLLEKYGKEYTVDDVGKLWLDILPMACTAEHEALNSSKPEPLLTVLPTSIPMWNGSVPPSVPMLLDTQKPEILQPLQNSPITTPF